MDAILGLKSLIIPTLAKNLNRAFGNYREPWQVATITTSLILGSIWLWNLLFSDDDSEYYQEISRINFFKVPLLSQEFVNIIKL